MGKIFKFLIYTIILLLGSITGATFYISIDIKEMFYKKELFNYDNQIVYEKIISYKKGLFESNAVTEVKLLNLPSVIKMHHTILHGPIIITKDPKKPIDFKFAIIKSYIDGSANTSIAKSLVISTVLNYKKEIESIINISIPKYTDELLQIADVVLESFVRITNNYFYFKSTAAAASIKTNYLGNELAVEGVTIKVNQTGKSTAFKINQTINTIDNGEGNVTINAEKIIQKQQEINVTNFKLNITNIIKNKLLNNSFGLDIEKIINKNEIYGPLHLKILIENIDLSQISARKANLKNHNPNEMYTALLLKKPKLIIDNSYLSLPQGDIKINLALSFSQIESHSKDAPDTTALPIGMPVAIDGEISLTISKEILKEILRESIQKKLAIQIDYEKLDPSQKQQELEMQIKLNLEQAIQNGTLIEKEEDYATKIMIINNNFKVNDKPIAEPSILFIDYMKMFKASKVTVKNPPAVLPQQPISPVEPVNNEKPF